MTEDEMRTTAQSLLAGEGIDDRVVAIGMFRPQRQPGSTPPDWVLGDLAGENDRDLADPDVARPGDGDRMRLGGEAALPRRLLVAPGDRAVYCFGIERSGRVPDSLVFALDPTTLHVQVYWRALTALLVLSGRGVGPAIAVRGRRFGPGRCGPAIAAINRLILAADGPADQA